MHELSDCGVSLNDLRVRPETIEFAAEQLPLLDLPVKRPVYKFLFLADGNIPPAGISARGWGTFSSSEIPQQEAHSPVRFPRLYSTIEGAGYRSTRGQLRSCSETTVAATGH